MNRHRFPFTWLVVLGIGTAVSAPVSADYGTYPGYSQGYAGDMNLGVPSMGNFGGYPPGTYSPTFPMPAARSYPNAAVSYPSPPLDSYGPGVGSPQAGMPMSGPMPGSVPMAASPNSCGPGCPPVSPGIPPCLPGYLAFGVELAFLNPHLGSMRVTSGGVTHDFDPDFEWDETVRYWAISQFSNGFSVRGDYWAYEEDYAKPTAIGRIVEWLKFDSVEVEGGQRFNSGCSELHVTGGMRYARLRRQFRLDPPNPAAGSTKTEFDGLGPTVSAYVRRPVTGGPFSLLASARGAWLFGDTQIDSEGLGLPPQNRTEAESMIPVWEIKLGVEFNVPLYLGGQFVIQAMWEAQTWQWNIDTPFSQEYIGFTGPTLAIAIFW